MESLPAVVLAAGASRRMGRPKALLPLEGMPCVERVLEAFRMAGQGPLILVLGADATAVRSAVAPAPGLIEVVNERWERGQTGSLKAGLRAVPPGAPGVYVMPVDHPLLGAADVRALAERFASAPEGKSLFVPTWHGRRGHPLLLGAEHVGAVLELEDGEPLRDYLNARSDQVEHVPASGPGVLRGMNTEEDYRAVLEELERGGTARDR